MVNTGVLTTQAHNGTHFFEDLLPEAPVVMTGVVPIIDRRVAAYTEHDLDTAGPILHLRFL